MSRIQIKSLALTILALFCLGLTACSPKAEPTTAKPVQVEEAKVAQPVADCSKLEGWKAFSDKMTTLSFCYPNAWGNTSLKETSVSPVARIGTVFHISFSNSEGNHPLISYSTPDYALTGNTDAPSFNWSSLDLNKNNTELTKLFSQYGKASIERINVAGHPALKVFTKGTDPLSLEKYEDVGYFIPQITLSNKPFNLRISCSPEQASDIDRLIGTLIF